MKFPFWISILTGILALLGAAVWQINEKYCAFGFGGLQCNAPFSGMKNMLFLLGIASVVITPISSSVLAYRLVKWWRNA